MEIYQKLVDNMLKDFKTMSCKMSLKVYMLHTHLDKFKSNIGGYSEKQGERFHQDISDLKRRSKKSDYDFSKIYIYTKANFL